MGLYSQQGPARSDMIQYTSLSDEFSANSGQVMGLQSQGVDASKTSVVRKGKSNSRQSSLRVTHPDLLSASERIPSGRLSSAPFLVMDEEPIDLEVVGKGQYSSLYNANKSY